MKPGGKISTHSLAVDVVLFTIENNQLEILLIKRTEEPFKGTSALPGGFVHEGETTRDTANRILKDKAGIENMFVEQLYTFDSPGRDPRGNIFTVTYFALAPREDIQIHVSEKSQNPQFVSVQTLPKLAFDHKDIIKYSIKRLQGKLEYTNAAYSLLPRYFTLAQLQKTYEIIFGQTFDKRNFQKKYFQLDLISPTKKMFKGGRQRPARLYEFKNRKLTELTKFI
jgi:8-oxo-dGTP diphosphatase